MDSNSAAGARLNWVLPCLIALFASLTFVPFPRQPYLLDDSLSEKAVLNYANEHHLHYGTDIVFTYGPWGYLLSRHYFPYAHTRQVAVVGLLSVLVGMGVCFLAWQMPLLWRTLLILLFVYLAANIDPRADLLIYSGILCWTWLCLVAGGGFLLFCSFCFALLSIFGVMVKANFLFITLLSLFVIIINLATKRKARFGLALAVAVLLLFGLAWVCSGQNLSQLPRFFSSSISIIQGYDQVVGLDAPPQFRIGGLFVLGFSLVAVILRVVAVGRPPDGRPLLPFAGALIATTLWVLFFVFVLWKHSFVRADLYHMGFLFGFSPLLALSLEVLPASRQRLQMFSRVFAVLVCLCAMISLNTLFFSTLKSSFVQPIAALKENFSALIQPGRYQTRMKKLFEETRAAARLPAINETVGPGSVDVFGQEQCYAIFNRLDYQPRPVFQSYLAFNEALMKLNEGFYLSAAAPRYVLFQLDAGDRIFPPLQDARLFRHLLLNFRPVKYEKPFLLLEGKRSSSAKLQLLQEGTALPGEHIVFPQAEGLLWLEIFLQPTTAGRVIQTLYKPAKIRIAFWEKNSAKPLTRSGAPTPMLAAGFISSPLFFRTEHVQDFFGATNIVRPAACSIEIPEGARRFWRRQLRYKIYAIETESASRAEQAAPWNNASSEPTLNFVQGISFPSSRPCGLAFPLQ